MKIVLTDISTTGGTEGQVPKINASGLLEYMDDGGGGSTYGIRSTTSSSKTTNPSNSSFAVTIPADAEVGDILFIGIQGIGNSAGLTITPPAGTTEIDEQSLNGVTDWMQGIYWHEYDGTEGGTLTFTFSQSVKCCWSVVCMYGVDTTTPFEGAGTATGTSASPTGVATATSSDDELVLNFYFDGLTGAGSGADWLTPGVGWTELIDLPKDDFAGQGEGNMGVTYQQVAVAGAVSAESATKSVNQRWRSFTLAVVPGGATSPPTYSFAFFFTTAPTASEVLFLHVAGAAFTIPVDFVGALEEYVGTNPAATFVLTIHNITQAVDVGTLTVSTTGVVTAATDGGTAKSIAQGDVLRVTGPASADASITNCAFTIIGVK